MKKLHKTKMNQAGFGWHVILPIIVVLMIGFLGVRLLFQGRAATPTYANGAIYYNGGYITPDGKNKGANDGFSQQAAFSPDGTKAAYGSGSGVFVEKIGNPAGISGGTQILNNVAPWANDGDGSGISWSQDGQWLAFGVGTSGGSSVGYPYSIGLVHPDGTGYTTVPGLTLTDSDGFFGVSWLPDSQTLLYMKGGDQLCSIKMDGSNNTCNTLPSLQGGQGTDYMNPQVSPDGTKVLLSGYTGAYKTPSGAEEPWINVYEFNIDGTGSKQLTNVPGISATQSYQNQADYAVWSPDGSKIAFSEGGDPSIVGLYTMNTDGTSQVRLDTVQATNIAWQPVAIGTEPMTVGSCTVTNLPTNPAPNATITPAYTITNTTPYPITVTPTEEVIFGSGASQQKSLAALTIPAGTTSTLTSALSFQDGYVAAGTANPTFYFALNVIGQNYYQNFNCRAATTYLFPVAAATGYCTVQAVPTSIKRGTAFTAKVQVYDNSISSFTPKLSASFIPNSGTAYNFPAYTQAKLIAGANDIQMLPKYTVSSTTKATSATVKATVTGASKTFTCSATTKITT